WRGALGRLGGAGPAYRSSLRQQQTGTFSWSPIAACGKGYAGKLTDQWQLLRFHGGNCRRMAPRPNRLQFAVEAVARVRLRELASIRRRFGYRRLHILLTREG